VPGVSEQEGHQEEQLVIVSMVLGPAQTNTYIIGDTTTDAALLIDPAWQGESIAKEVADRGWRVGEIALTHAHFDHIGGIAGVIGASDGPITIGMHAADEFIRSSGGGAQVFGFSSFDPGPEPTINYEDTSQIKLGDHTFEIRHTPGHSPGHVVIILKEAKLVFCGDLIFQRSVGRTDLPGGSSQELLQSIRSEILSLPDDTRLLPGHGPATTVGEERRFNPFITGDLL
jgi:glyoxylase-like metal-dependent hydrolase (beta-lactamase superfamily II)